MTNEGMSERAERLSKRRARMLPLLAVLYLTQQATFFTALDPAGHDTARYVKLGSWLVLSLLLLAAVATRGFWLVDSKTRELIDDELTRAHRLDAMRAGFIAAMLAAIASVFLSMMDALRPSEVAQLVLSLGLAAALIRFGLLERRAHGGE